MKPHRFNQHSTLTSLVDIYLWIWYLFNSEIFIFFQSNWSFSSTFVTEFFKKSINFILNRFADSNSWSCRARLELWNVPNFHYAPTARESRVYLQRRLPRFLASTYLNNITIFIISIVPPFNRMLLWILSNTSEIEVNLLAIHTFARMSNSVHFILELGEKNDDIFYL